MKYFVLILLIQFGLQVQAQLNGCFPAHAGQPVSLSTYSGLQRTQVATATADSQGCFSLAYPADYRGVAFLQINNSNGIELILNGEGKLTLRGSSIQDIDNLVCEDNAATSTLYTYFKQQTVREKAYAGWKYLKKLYSEDTYLQKQNKSNQIDSEIALLEKGKVAFIKAQENSYLGWYLLMITLVRDIMPSIYTYRERIPQHTNIFMHTDFSDERFYHSGLLPVLMENYYFMLENSGATTDSMYVQMNKTTDYIIGNLMHNKPGWVQETSLFLFKLFEKRSLYPAAEHVSLLMLAQPGISLDTETRNRFDGYRIMKPGNVAPDINFGKAIARQKEKHDDDLVKYLKGYRSLAAIGNEFKLVIFGQGGCPECSTQMKKLKQMYPQIQAHDMEVVYVSLNTSRTDFEPVATEYPWASYFDYDGWNSKPVTDYRVFASPTMYLLGKNLEILYKVTTPEHLDAILKVLGDGK